MVAFDQKKGHPVSRIIYIYFARPNLIHFKTFHYGASTEVNFIFLIIIEVIVKCKKNINIFSKKIQHCYIPSPQSSCCHVYGTYDVDVAVAVAVVVDSSLYVFVLS
jgi:hypothetical protein